VPDWHRTSETFSTLHRDVPLCAGILYKKWPQLGGAETSGLEGPALLRKKANRPAVIRFDGEKIDVEAMLPRFKL
jgi:hypothetical protein